MIIPTEARPGPPQGAAIVQSWTTTIPALYRSLCGSVTMAPDIVSPGSEVSAGDAAQQKDAFLYIVVVLGVYSLGIVFMVIKYLRQEKRDLEEEHMVEDFLTYKPVTAGQERAKISGRLALNALNAANLITQPGKPRGKVTFV